MDDRRSRGRGWAMAGGIAVIIAAVVVIVVLVAAGGVLEHIHRTEQLNQHRTHHDDLDADENRHPPDLIHTVGPGTG